MDIKIVSTALRADATTKANAAEAAAIAAASTDATSKANAAQSSAISAAASDATAKASAAETAANAYSDGLLSVEVDARVQGDADTLVSSKAYTDSLLVGAFRAAGNHDASAGTWPSAGSGTGTAGAIRRGDTYKVSVAGTMGGVNFDVGDSFYANTNTPGQTASNWDRFEHNDDQATESYRGTLAVATQSVVENESTTNDESAVTPKKLWLALARFIILLPSHAGFLSSVRGTVLTGLSLASTAAVTASDTILSAIGKLQAWRASLEPVFLTYTGGSQVFNSTSLADVTSTSFSLGIGTYEIEWGLRYNASGTATGANFAVNGTAVFDYLIGNVQYSPLAGDRDSGPILAFNGAFFASSTENTTNNAGVVTCKINVTTAGTIYLRAAAESGGTITITSVIGSATKR